MKRLLASVLLAGTAAAQPTAQPVPLPLLAPLVQTDWLQRELARPELVILQLSSTTEYAKAHIPGSLPIDLARDLVAPAVDGGLRTELPTADALAAVLREKGITGTSRVVIVFDQPGAITRAGRAFFTLEWAGLAGRVTVLDGGLQKWVREGRYVASGPGRAARAGNVVVRPEPARRASRDDVRGMLGVAGSRIVDARDTVFYQDLRDNQMPRGGHIATAVNLPFSALSNADGTLRSREELELLLRESGIGADERVTAYCHIGMQASWMYFALRVLGRDVRMFDGSFDEWSRDATLPVEGARPRPE